VGDRRTVDYRLTAKEVADDIAREINGDSGEGSFHGVFVSAEAKPSEPELAEARRKSGLDSRRELFVHRDRQKPLESQLEMEDCY
jgi:hypothetical protein